MKELSLSNNLSQIELEINHHKQMAGQSIWEIGRRLNHVKEHDLTHGEFGRWRESIGFSKTQAHRFMRVSKELKVPTSEHIGLNALYLISTLPEEEREKEHTLASGETKTTDEMTVRELQEVKKRLKEKDQQIENLKWDNAQKDEEIEAARKETKIIEKEIIKEIKPDDYDELRLNNQQLNNALREANRSHDLMQEQYNHLVSQQKEEDENSKKYEELTQAIQEMEGKMDRTQKLIQAQKQVYELVDMSKELLMKITPIPYLIDSELVRENPVAKRELENIANQTQSFLNNLNDALKESRIMEGEFTNAE